jgi:hypothetical protein
VDDFCAARSGTIPPLPWTNFAPPLSHYLGEVTSRIIREEVHRDTSEAAEIDAKQLPSK